MTLQGELLPPTMNNNLYYPSGCFITDGQPFFNKVANNMQYPTHGRDRRAKIGNPGEVVQCDHPALRSSSEENSNQKSFYRPLGCACRFCESGDCGVCPDDGCEFKTSYCVEYLWTMCTRCQQHLKEHLPSLLHMLQVPFADCDSAVHACFGP